jgi:two-component system sensor histidine kinase/response regulator
MDNFKDKHILIIDDNPMNLLFTSKTLENYGFKASTAESGALGIDFLESEIPSLILLDVMMPEVDGYEVCRMIKKVEKWKEIPIIFLTANDQTENIVEGFDAGGVDYITKPFKNEELLVRVKNHIELAESRKTIIEMIRSRDKLYSIIAHDIRSPLSAILQTIDAIDQGYFDTSSEDFIEIIHHLRIRANDTSTLLNSLLQWTRVQDNRVHLHLQNTNVFQLIASCVQLLEGVAQNKNISISMDVPENLEAWCDEVSMNTVIRNIISNSIKFTPNMGKITILATNQDDSIEICIKDTGVGMSDEALNKIFKENQHFTSSGTENEQGTGLGLMLVKDFIKKNEGVLNVKSKLGQGTEFNIKLPLTH